jgi:hypothetical protein
MHPPPRRLVKITELPEYFHCKLGRPCAYLRSGNLAKVYVSNTGVRVAELRDVNVLFDSNNCSIG